MTINNPAKIRFNCRRGMSELEEVLYPFFDSYFGQLSEEQQEAFADLLTAEDTELWDWLVIRQADPPAKYAKIVRLIHDAT